MEINCQDDSAKHIINLWNSYSNGEKNVTMTTSLESFIKENEKFMKDRSTGGF